MREATTSRGTKLRVPDHVRVVEAGGNIDRVRRGRVTPASASADKSESGLIQALVSGADGLSVHDRFVLDPVAVDVSPAPEPFPSRDRRRGRNASGAVDGDPSDKTEIKVSLDEGENAALLVETAGVYVWHLPELALPAAGRRRRLEARPGAAGSGKTVVFLLGQPTGASSISGSSANAPLGRRGLNDWVRGKVVDRVRATVVKWVAGKAMGPAMRLLERNVRPGLVDMGNSDPQTWRVDGIAPSLPKHRPARILAFIHGTFSSTIGSFGALGITREGRSFLKEARQHYDSVLAFDHATLGESPKENAEAIARAVGNLAVDPKSRLDIVAFSRGGLVARLLVERHLAGRDRLLTPGKVIYVGCTNGGTALADPANWKALLDIHTNLVVAAGRALTLFGAAPAGRVVAESVKTLSAFVQAIVDTAIKDEMVPGLASMMPTSSLILELNTSPIAPDAPDIHYHAIGSDFEPKLFGNDAVPQALPKRFLQALVDMGVDNLMDEKNDLVVDTEAMTLFGLHNDRLGESRLWSRNTSLYHTNYFTHPEVVHSLSRWLLAEGADRNARWRKEDIEVVSADTCVAEVADMIAKGPGVIVFDRPGYGVYVRSSNELKGQLRTLEPDRPVGEALDLDKFQIAEVEKSGVTADVSRISAMGWVRFDEGTVVEAILPAATSPELPEPTANSALASF